MGTLSARGISVFWFVASVLVAASLAFQQPIVVLALCAYAVLLWFRPTCWLLVVPAALPVLDFAPWTGRLIFDEFDLMIMLTLAVTWGRLGRDDKRTTVVTPGRVVLWAFAALTVAGLVLGYGEMRPSIGETSLAYFLPDNALRVAKGYLFAVGLITPLASIFSANPEKGAQLLTRGVQTGLALLGAVVLWERGVADALVSGDGLNLALHRLMDFSGTYRITGMFSGMHTGGEAIDGYLVTALPIAVYGLVRAGTVRGRIWALSVLAIGTYALLVTLTRATYLAFMVAMVVAGAATAYMTRRKISASWPAPLYVLISLTALTGALFAVRMVAGFQALVANVIAIWVVVGLASQWKRAPLGLVVAVVIASVAFAAHQIRDDMLENAFFEHSPMVASLSAGGIALLLGLAAVSLARGGLRATSGVNGATVLAAATIIWLVGLPAAGGFALVERFSSTSSDMDIRLEHWRNVHAILGDGIVPSTFGNGVGTFPIRYHLRFGDSRFPNSYRVKKQDGGEYLQIDPGLISLLQRVSATSGEQYRVSVLMRTPTTGFLRVTICPRNILYFDSVSCPAVRFSNATANSWQQLSATVQAGRRGSGTSLNWPLTLKIDANNGVIDVGEIQVADATGSELVANGRFESALERWFMVSNFDHLPWHTKNIYLHVLVEQGYLGLGVFLVLGVMALMRALSSAGRGHEFALPVVGALVGFFIVGVFGSPLDMPRVAMFFYLMCGLAFVATTAAPMHRESIGVSASTPPPSQPADIESGEFSELNALVRLRKSDTLSEAQFAEAKRRLLFDDDAGA